MEACIIKLGHLTRMLMGTLGCVKGIKSSRVLVKIMEKIWQSLSPSLRDFAGNQVLADQWADNSEYVFPSLMVSLAFEEQPEGE